MPNEKKEDVRKPEFNVPESIPVEQQEFEFTSEQLGVTREFKKMVGAVLTVVEAAVPEGVQQKATKKLVQNKMYDGLKAILGELES